MLLSISIALLSHFFAVDLDAPEENLIINELIREYLRFNGYTNTLSVFVPESRMGSQPSLEPVFLQSELGLHPTSATSQPRSEGTRLPLLYSAVSKLRRSRTAMIQSSTTGGGIRTTSTSSSTESSAFSGSTKLSVETSTAGVGAATNNTGNGTASDRQRLDDLDNPFPISFKNI